MKNEYDFLKSVGDKFQDAEVDLNLPIYLDREIADFAQKLSVEKKIDRSQIVNHLLRKDMEIIKL